MEFVVGFDDPAFYKVPIPSLCDMALKEETRHAFVVRELTILAVVVPQEAENNALHHGSRVVQLWHDVLVEVHGFLVCFAVDSCALDADC